jgi:hypothetical protein
VHCALRGRGHNPAVQRRLHFDPTPSARGTAQAAALAVFGAASLALVCAFLGCGDDDASPPRPADAGTDLGADAGADLGAQGDAGDTDAGDADAGDTDAGGEVDGGHDDAASPEDGGFLPDAGDAGPGADAGGGMFPDAGATVDGGDVDAGAASDGGTATDGETPPAGETCDDAIDATAGGVFTGDTRRPVRNDYDARGPGCPRGVGGGDLVYRLSPASTMRYRVRVEPLMPAWDPSLYVMSDCATQTCVAGTVLNRVGEPEELECTVMGGTTAYVVVDGELVSSGPFRLTVTPLL